MQVQLAQPVEPFSSFISLEGFLMLPFPWTESCVNSQTSTEIDVAMMPQNCFMILGNYVGIAK